MRSTQRSREQRETAANRLLALGVAALVLVGAVTVAVAMARSNPKPSLPAAKTQIAAGTAKKSIVKPVNGPVSVTRPKDVVAVAKAPVKQKVVARTPPRSAPRHSARVAVAAKTIPDKMRSLLRGSTQMIVVTGTKLGSNSGTLRIFNESGTHWAQVLVTGADFGKAGLTNGVTRKSGHLNTPTGIWRLGSFIFGQHTHAPAETKMPYRPITSTSWWSSEPNSTYNTWVNSSAHVSGEHLQDSRVQYEYAFDSGYNSPPNSRVIGRGTAIFVHCFEPAGNSLGRYTHGCVAISRTAMTQVLRILDPKRHPSCAIGTLRAGTTSIYSY